MSAVPAVTVNAARSALRLRSPHVPADSANDAARRAVNSGGMRSRDSVSSRRCPRKQLSDSRVVGLVSSSSANVPNLSSQSAIPRSGIPKQRRPRACRAAAEAAGSSDRSGDRTDTVVLRSQSHGGAESELAEASGARGEGDRLADSELEQHERPTAAASAAAAAAAGEAETAVGLAREASSPGAPATAAAAEAAAAVPAAAVPAASVPVVLLSLLAMALVLCNADRVIMSVAILPLSAVNGWPPSVAGIVQSSFLWGYLITPIIGGSLADRHGGHPVLAAGLALWSVATLLTPLAAASSLGALLTARAVMGLGEGVALPCMNYLVSRHVPDSKRAWAVGICFAGFHLGSMLGLLSAPSLMALPALGVTGPFYVFGAAGLLWLALWLLLPPAGGAAAAGAAAAGASGSEQPRAGMQQHEGERRALEKQQEEEGGSPVTGRGAGKVAASDVTVWQLLSHPASWAIIIANVANNWGYFILLSFMPLYFNQVLHTDIRQAAWFSAGPWAVMAGVGLLAGGVADRFEERGGMSRTAVRKVMQAIGFLGPAASLLLLARMPSAPLAALCLTAALGLSAFSQAGFLLNHKDIAPRHVGLLHGLSNTAGSLAGISSTIATGFMVEHLGSFHAVLALTAAVYALAAAFWLRFATAKVVFP